MAVMSIMASVYSENGKYFAQLTADSKLKIWETLAGTLEHEFTPDFHLKSPCTCLHFVQPTSVVNQNHSPKKKKRRESVSEITTTYVALGTSTGLLLLYSISKADVEFKIDSETSQNITSISWNKGNILFSTVDQNIVSWNLDKRNIQSMWKGGNEKLTAVLVIPGNRRILTAARNIKLWDVDSKQVLQTFVGHSNEVHILRYVNPRNSDAYVISGSRGDRLLNVWNLKEESRENSFVAGFLMEDIPTNVAIHTSEGISMLVAITRSGVVHFYRHTLNGKCNKPIKPRATVQVASKTDQTDTLVTPIPIVNAFLSGDQTLGITYGDEIVLSFEHVVLNDYEKMQCLIRKDPRSLSSENKEKTVTKIRTPIVDKNVHYLTPHSSAVGMTKRKVDGKNEVPMEKRLENLMLNKLDGKSKIPKVDNVAQLLIQGLHSKDKTILGSVLQRQDEKVIRNTVKRLPMPVIVPFVQEISNLIQGKTVLSQVGALWLKNLLQLHAGILLSNPELPDLLGPILNSIESRLSLINPLDRLRGRLDLLVSQVDAGNSINEENEDEALLIFNDKESSDSDSEGMEIDGGVHSESDNEWVEESSEVENEEQDSSDDVEMV